VSGSSDAVERPPPPLEPAAPAPKASRTSSTDMEMTTFRTNPPPEDSRAPTTSRVGREKLPQDRPFARRFPCQSESTPMSITHLFAGIAVSDFVAARRWYEALFGRPPDMLPKEGEAVWHVTNFGSVYVTEDPSRAGSALVTIAVSNLDEYATALAARGLSLDEQRADSSAPRQLTITDDDGNCIKFFGDPAYLTA